MKTSEHLRAMRDLLAVPERWTKNCMARTADYAKTHSLDPLAVSWCLEGACYKTIGSTNQLAGVLDFLWSATDGCITYWNDWIGRTHAEVIALLDAAIALAESEGK